MTQETFDTAYLGLKYQGFKKSYNQRTKWIKEILDKKSLFYTANESFIEYSFIRQLQKYHDSKDSEKMQKLDFAYSKDITIPE